MGKLVMSDSPLIELQQLSLSLGGNRLLNNLSLKIYKEESYVVIGPNGAGKTTLLKAFLGLLKQSCGGIRITGRDSASFTRRDLAKLIAYVPQLLEVEVPYTVREFVEMGRYSFCESNSKKKGIVQQSMARVGVEQFAERTMGTLSGGERQRVCIAAALAQQAPLLVLDEPLVHLDPGQRLEVKHVIQELSKEVCLFVVTHDLKWASEGFSQVLALKAGELIYSGIPEDLEKFAVFEALFGKGFRI